MEENCSIKLFESDLESMLSQVLAKARSRDEKLKAVSELNGRKFLLKVDKPYGCVYAVNKLYIPNMEFVYGR